MPCCGKKRLQARQKTQTRRAPEPIETTVSQPEPQSVAYFQYLGKTGVTVIGPRTRKRYRFGHTGAVIAVDRRDGRALATVSVLRQVRKSTNVTKKF